MSKGSWYRKVDQKKWDEGWEKAFGKRCSECGYCVIPPVCTNCGHPCEEDKEDDEQLRPDVREDDDGCNGDEEAVSDHTDRGGGVENETTDGGR